MDHVLLIWAEGDWRCELHPRGGGEARLKILHAEEVIAVEPTYTGRLAYARAEILRQRVRRGNLRAD